MWKCEKCGNDLEYWGAKCPKCNEVGLEQSEEIQQYKNPYSKALYIFAVIELISSIIVAIYIWANYGTMEVGTYYTIKEFNPLGIGVGFVVLIQGIVIYVILSALKVMAEDISDVKNHQFQHYGIIGKEGDHYEKDY